MAERYYSSVAVQTNLSSGIGTSDTSIQVDSTTGFPPQTPYTLIIDIDTPSEEIVEVTGVAGSVLTVTREIDGSVAQEHEIDASVTHGATARDWQDSRDHEEASSQIHGLGAGDGTLVGTASTDTLENKTIDGGDNTLQNIPQSAVTNLISDQNDQDAAIAANAVAIGVNADDIEALDTRLSDEIDDLQSSLPRGIVQHARRTGANQEIATGGGLVDVTGMSVTRTFDSSRRYRIKGYIHVTTTAHQSNEIVGLLALHDGSGVAEQSGTVLFRSSTTIYPVRMDVEYVFVPNSTGSMTFKLQARATEDIEIRYSDSRPGILTVEDVGAA